MAEHTAESGAPCRWCDFTDAACRASRSGGYIKCCPDCDHRAPALSNACTDCGDCYHPTVGPNTDGEPCEWCRDCGCHSADHIRMTRVAPPVASAS